MVSSFVLISEHLDLVSGHNILTMKKHIISVILVAEGVGSYEGY